METKEYGEPLLRAATVVRTAIRPKRVLILWSGPLHEINDYRAPDHRAPDGALRRWSSPPCRNPGRRASDASSPPHEVPAQPPLRSTSPIWRAPRSHPLRKRAEGEPWTWSVTYDPLRTTVWWAWSRPGYCRRQVRPRGERRLRFLRRLHRPQAQPRYPFQAVGISPHRAFRARARGRYQAPVPRPGGALQDLHPRQIISSIFAYVDLRPFRDLGERKEVLFVASPSA